MKKIKVNLHNRSYDIFVQKKILVNIRDVIFPFIRDRKCFIITDHNVDKLYSNLLLHQLKDLTEHQVVKYTFPAGEQNKNLNTIENIYHYLLSNNIDRSSLIIALGGGVCGDMAGFAASTIMRGIDFIQVPTTLLAMVDSSVGGKTGVDLPEGKNLIGSFWQPGAVFIDPETLRSLPDREIISGLAEIIKYGMITDANLFEYLEKNVKKLNRPDTDIITNIIVRCCQIKSDIVSKDEKEKSLRAILNFGHTFGHAIEAASEYEQYNHGESIAAGMLIATRLAVNLEMIKPEIELRLKKLLTSLSLPVKLENLKAENILKLMHSDKKNKNNNINFVLPDKAIGKVKIVDNIDNRMILETIRTYI